MARFDKRTAIVTGAASGFGEAIARRLASEGARVALADLDAARGQAVASDIAAKGGETLFVRTDVSAGAEVEKLVAATVEHFGGLDLLVNNAGIGHRPGPLWEMPDADFDRVFAVNVKGVYLGVRAAIPALRARGGGAIVNTASIGALRPRPGLTAYNASKGAVVTLTRGLALELAPLRIRVNAVLPVAADTGFMATVWGERGMPDAARADVVRGIPLGRLAEPADVAAAVCFLASEDAAFLTGVCLDVDGGRSIG